MFMKVGCAYNLTKERFLVTLEVRTVCCSNPQAPSKIHHLVKFSVCLARTSRPPLYACSFSVTEKKWLLLLICWHQTYNGRTLCLKKKLYYQLCFNIITAYNIQVMCRKISQLPTKDRLIFVQCDVKLAKVALNYPHLSDLKSTRNFKYLKLNLIIICLTNS